MGVNIEVSGPVQEKDTIHEIDEHMGTTSVNTNKTAESMISVSDEKAAEFILQFFEDKREFYTQVSDLEDTEYWIPDLHEWSARISGKNETRPIALAATIAAEDGDYENGLHALTTWANDDSFPFNDKALYLAKRASSDGVLEDIVGWYDEEVSF